MPSLSCEVPLGLTELLEHPEVTQPCSWGYTLQVHSGAAEGLNSPVHPAWGRTSNLILPVMLKSRKTLFISIDKSLTQLLVSCFRQFRLGALLAGG